MSLDDVGYRKGHGIKKEDIAGRLSGGGRRCGRRGGSEGCSGRRERRWIGEIAVFGGRGEGTDG